jgi:hypothetical protein
VNKEVKGQKLKVKSGDEITVDVPNIPKSPNTPKTSKDDMMLRMMSKRLDKKEKKAGVNVTVRTKKKN